MDTTQNNEYYGLSLKLVDHDAEYLAACTRAAMEGRPAPILINDVAKSGDSQDVVECVNNNLQTRIIDEELNNAPICSLTCTDPISQRYNLGNVCPTCGSVVRKREMESEVWLEAPDEVGTFVNPRFWMLFAKYFGIMKLKKFERGNAGTLSRHCDIMAWLTDATYKPDHTGNSGRSRFTAMTTLLTEFGWVRNVQYFKSNYRSLMEYLTREEVWHQIMGTTSTRREAMQVKRAKSERDRQYWIKFYKMYENEVFSKYLPLLSPMLIVAEEFDGRVTVDPVFSAQVDAATTIGSIYTHERQLRDTHIIGRAMRANRQLAYFYVDYRREVKSQKPGHYRGKCSSTFVPFSGRATISPESGIHDPYALKTPWRWTINLLSIQIENKLAQRGYTPNEILRIMDYGCMQYVKELEDIFYELVAESPGGRGIMVVPLRNPTLVQLSVEALYLTEIITDVNQCSLRISVTVIKPMNADFDGDQLMVWLPVDSIEQELAEHLLPENGIVSAASPNEVDGGMSVHNELISMQNRYLRCDEEDTMPGTGL